MLMSYSSGFNYHRIEDMLHVLDTKQSQMIEELKHKMENIISKLDSVLNLHTEKTDDVKSKAVVDAALLKTTKDSSLPTHVDTDAIVAVNAMSLAKDTDTNVTFTTSSGATTSSVKRSGDTAYLQPPELVYVVDYISSEYNIGESRRSDISDNTDVVGIVDWGPIVEVVSIPEPMISGDISARF